MYFPSTTINIFSLLSVKKFKKLSNHISVTKLVLPHNVIIKNYILSKITFWVFVKSQFKIFQLANEQSKLCSKNLLRLIQLVQEMTNSSYFFIPMNEFHFLILQLRTIRQKYPGFLPSCMANWDNMWQWGAFEKNS